MSCEQAMADLSAAADGELAPERAEPLDSHLTTCANCAAFQRRLVALRQQLRFEPVGAVPDLAPRVMAAVRAGGVASPARRAPHTARSGRFGGAPPGGGPALRPGAPSGRSPGRQGRGLVPVAAAFVCGVVLGATFIGVGRRPGQVALADLPARVVAAQQELTSLAADVTLVERGWHPRVPERRFAGRLRYRAPEHLALELADRTVYPSAAWAPADLALVVTGDRWWTRSRRACPVEAQPDCAPATPQVRLVERREPFADATPVPLDLLTPVRSFTPAGGGAPLGTRRVGGRTATGVATTAAQMAPLLSAIAPAGSLQPASVGNLRALHPSDRVELWLDESALVPLALRVTVAPGAERRAWAAARGYPDRPGQVVLELSLSRVSLNRPLAERAFPPPPPGSRAGDAGFEDLGPGGPAARGTSRAPTGTGGSGGAVARAWAGPEPAWLPDGFRPYRAGVAGGAPGAVVGVRTWTDGRAWVKVRAIRDWPGGRLFGDLGQLVRPAGLGAGVAYWSEDGTRVAVHGTGVDVVVTGSLCAADLARVAASLPVAGRPVPSGWAEAATTTLAEATAAAPGLRRPRDLAGFAPPAVRVDGRTVTLAYAGPGSRGFLLVQAPGDRLAPPLDDDPVGVAVRGRTGRWSPGRGELEWVEQDRTIGLRSTTLSLEELLAIAAVLEPA